jgi:hypothetical protein
LARQERASGRYGQRKGVRSSDASGSAQSLSPLSWLYDQGRGLVRFVHFLPLLWLRPRVRCHGSRRASGRGRSTPPPASTAAISRQAPIVKPNLPIGRRVAVIQRAARTWRPSLFLPLEALPSGEIRPQRACFSQGCGIYSVSCYAYFREVERRWLPTTATRRSAFLP